FGREGQEKVLAHLKSAALKQRQQDLVGGAGIGGALEHDQLAAMQLRGDRGGGVDDEGQVGGAPFAQRGGHADDGGVALAQLGKVGGRPQPPGLDQARDALGG